MRLVDRLLGAFRLYRRARGGRWELWYVSVDGEIDEAWFGPMRESFSERLHKIELADSAALSMARMLPVHERERVPELEDLARPTSRCVGVPKRVEDHRVQSLLNDKPH